MHLHVVEPDLRRRGLGARFVQISAGHYFRALELQRLFCEPNAFNVAPNRALQRAGFRYLFTHECRPGPMNFLPRPGGSWSDRARGDHRMGTASPAH